MLSKMKDSFILNEIWLLTTMGGFQRTNLYDSTVNADENERKAFREALHLQIKDISLTHYINIVNEREHINNIKKIYDNSSSGRFSHLLNNGKLNFGVSQKLLNLYLKYLWCIKKINTPPHFPVDRIIQVNLNKKAQKLGLKRRKVTAWTKIENENEYMEIIIHANNVLDKSKFKNLAELELALFNRN